MLLISPGIIRWTDLDFGLPHLVALGGWLRARLGVRVEILDLNYEGGDHASLARTIDDMGPLLCVGIAAYTSFDLLRVHALATFLKQRLPDVPLVAGGYHASALPDDLVFEGSPFDAVVVGEGELPFERIVATRMGGGQLEQKIWGPERVDDMDDLPPYAWDLLDRYWPRCNELGRKLQIYLSRGCPYHCTFCMERSKSGYSWRAFSPERALSELERLAARTDLSNWVVNVADPLFGFHRRWRREVLEGILQRGIQPRQFWTLTRTDDLDDDDVRLLAQARFSIGIGMESGSPTMLRIMQKGNEPHRYLDNLRRLAGLSRVHGLSWAANIIVGHPGETHETMRETHAFVQELFLSAKDTCGWVSIDPFRLYPGAAVHEQQEAWSKQTGAVFHHPRWWWSWYDGPFRAQHIEPSHTLSYEERVRFMVDAYGPVVAEVQKRFRGQGRSVDRVFERSLAEQRELLSPARRDSLIAQGRRALKAPPVIVPRLNVPIGLHMKDPWVRRREEAVRRLLDGGVLRTATIIEALLQVGPERFMSQEDAVAVLLERTPAVALEGALPAALGVRTVALGLEALAPGAGDVVADATARTGWMAAVLSELVGEEGSVLAVHAGSDGAALRAALAGRSNVTVEVRPQARLLALQGPFDALWIGAALPRFPKALVAALRAPDGRAVTAVGPRFRPQDLVVISHGEAGHHERTLARVTVPVLGGAHGWLPAPPAAVAVEAWPAPALAYGVLSSVDLGRDAASTFSPAVGRGPWSERIAAAWAAAPGRLGLIAVLLRHRELDALLAELRAPRGGLADPAGRALCAVMADAIAEQRPDFERGWELTGALRKERLAGARRLATRWAGWREKLYVAQGAPPPLLVLDVPALGRRGRATTVQGRRVVAVDLGQPEEHAALQVLHEELHPITDPVVLAEQGGGARDTRPGEAGWALHRELERVAVAATHAFLQAHDPSWLPALKRWMA